MAVTKMKFQPELNAENVTVDTYPMAQEKGHTYKRGNVYHDKLNKRQFASTTKTKEWTQSKSKHLIPN